MYRLINDLLHPYTVMLLVTACCAAWICRRRESRWATRLLIMAVAGLLIFSIPALSDLSIATLERQSVPLSALPDDTEAIVILAGGLLPPSDKQPRAIPAEDTLYRCLAGAELYHGKRCLVVASGGSVASEPEAPRLAQVMRELLVQLGVDASDIVMEARSTTTYENAVESQRLLERLGRQRIVLVTEALHMPRAASCFRAVGLNVTEAPCHFASDTFDWRLENYLPSAGAARGNERVIHEWLGILWYWLKGRI